MSSSTGTSTAGSGKRDMRRAELMVPYVEPAKEDGVNGGDVASSLGTMVPMATILTKNKVIGWFGVILSLQAYLAETPDQRRAAATPGYFSVGMAFMALMTSYLPLFLPPVPGQTSQAPAASS